MKDINYRSVSILYVLFVWEVKSKRGSLFSKCQYVKRDPVHWHRRIGPLCQLSNLMNKSAGRKKFPILLPPLHKAVTRSRNEFALTLGLIYVLRLIRPHPPHMRSGIKMSLSRCPDTIHRCLHFERTEKWVQNETPILRGVSEAQNPFEVPEYLYDFSQRLVNKNLCSGALLKP